MSEDPDQPIYENEDYVTIIDRLLKLKGVNVGEIGPILETLAMAGPRGTVHTRFPNKETCLSYSLMKAGNRPFNDKHKTGFACEGVDVFLSELPKTWISLGGGSRKEWVKMREAAAKADMNMQDKIKEQYGEVIG